ncbi:vegetative cell wall protein gp1-like isoform X2 [Salvelinus namaycush]|nr:vegetative cell wall protein gp1-like isoform X2 [Salvelinus namaycush]
MMNQTSMAEIQRLYEATVKVAINTHTPTLQPSNPPPVAAQELSDTVAPQETSYTPILNQVEPLISPTTQETNSNSLSMTQSNPSNPIQPHPTPSYPIQPYPTPSNPILPHPTVSYPIQPHPTPSNRVLPHPTPHNPILPHPTVSYPTQPHSTTSNRILPHQTPSYLIQPCPTPSYPTQPHPTPSNRILPHPTPSYPIQPRPRKRKYDYMQKECPVHPGQTIFPILKILANRTSNEGQEQKVRWKPCSGCGKKWDDDWIKAEDRVSPV